MTLSEIAKYLGVHRTTVYRWSNGTLPVPLYAKRACVGLDNIPDWLKLDEKRKNITQINIEPDNKQS